MKKQMSFNINKVLFVVFISGASLLFACNKQRNNETQISKSGDDESHYIGRNCMECHYTEGKGEGWFSVAGTIKGNFTNSLVHIYSDLDKTNKLKSIEVDALGNFFTTESVDFTNGVYPEVELNDGSILNHTIKLTNGQCNLCHGQTTNEIIIN